MKKMIYLNPNYIQTASVGSEDITNALANLNPEIKRIATLKKTDTPYALFDVPTDSIKVIRTCIDKKRALKPAACIVIGIGGSNLGTQAVYQAIKGVMHAVNDADIPLYFVDTVDTDYVAQIYKYVEQQLKQNRSIIINVVSKSGITTETIANFEFFLALIKRYKPKDYADYIVATTDNDSKLWRLAQSNGFACLPIPDSVGGRFSVFTAVGLFPLGLAGIDIEQLLAGAADITPTCLETTQTNSAAVTACVLYAWYKKNVDIFNMFLFCVELEGVGKWWRQLVGESLGKQFATDGSEVRISLVPIVSIGTTDLHSVGQRYFGGKRNIGTLFVTIDQYDAELTLPNYAEFDVLVDNIQGTSLAHIMHALIHGTQSAYQKGEMPYLAMQLPTKNEYCIGQFLQYKMIEVVYLAYLLQINPFDQPAVQMYKQEAKRLLA